MAGQSTPEQQVIKRGIIHQFVLSKDIKQMIVYGQRKGSNEDLYNEC
ncbi:hypothetical protein EV06_1959 [Prochlorococcus sp. MIT 0602]|nr:hypothetical protein EV06_1959 [Prochlorococcus sp. MIT 0602]KGG15672.1 hypothetical protein EV07_1637 [Prochlorococcus sp. MIT 0603]